MRFNIFSNITNGAGLQRDYHILKNNLEAAGHQVAGIPYPDTPQNLPTADINLFLEIVEPRVMQMAPRNFYIPNSEWYFPCWDKYLPRMDRVLCKTQDCFQIWAGKVGVQKCRYISFEAGDFYRPEIPRERKFLHMSGKSLTKNTAAVAAAWKEYKIPHQLTVVAYKPEIIKDCVNIPNVTHITRLTEEQVVEYMNSHWFHVMPSKYEGYGHYIHEALGCGGVVLTTNAPPMAQFPGVAKDFLIQVVKRERMRAAWFNHVNTYQIADAVNAVARIDDQRLKTIGEQARAGFLAERAHFRKAFAEVINGG
jgi:glycosyltransferase involved in cell wall biosynthesis